METSDSKTDQPKSKEQLAEDLKRSWAYWHDRYSTFGAFILFGTLIGLLIYPIRMTIGFIDGSVSIFEPNTERQEKFLFNALLFGLLLLLGVSLFIFRKRQKFWYGLAETLFAATNSYTTAINLSTRLTTNSLDIYLAGFASVYLLVRGLSNLDEGLFQPFFQRDRILLIRAFLRKWLLSWYYRREEL